MFNLYSITRNQEAIRRLFRVMRGLTGNLPPLPAVYPDTMAPVVRMARDGERELSMMRWGFPPPPNLGSVPVTNVRNLKSPEGRGRRASTLRVPDDGIEQCCAPNPCQGHAGAFDETRRMRHMADGLGRRSDGIAKAAAERRPKGCRDGREERPGAG
jgi:hypothetical protein